MFSQKFNNDSIKLIFLPLWELHFANNLPWLKLHPTGTSHSAKKRLTKGTFHAKLGQVNGLETYQTMNANGQLNMQQESEAPNIFLS